MIPISGRLYILKKWRSGRRLALIPSTYLDLHIGLIGLFFYYSKLNGFVR
jgi:hypothetical protein